MRKRRDDPPVTMTQREAIRLLERYGWSRTTGGGHVVKMEKPGQRPITLPYQRRQVYSKGLTHRILKQAGIVEVGDE